MSTSDRNGSLVVSLKPATRSDPTESLAVGLAASCMDTACPGTSVHSKYLEGRGVGAREQGRDGQNRQGSLKPCRYPRKCQLACGDSGEAGEEGGVCNRRKKHNKKSRRETVPCVATNNRGPQVVGDRSFFWKPCQTHNHVSSAIVADGNDNIWTQQGAKRTNETKHHKYHKIRRKNGRDVRPMLNNCKLEGDKNGGGGKDCEEHKRNMWHQVGG